MQHSTIFKRDGHYAGMPNMEILSDGRLVAAARVQTWADHEPVGSWRAFVSEDEGATWTETEDSAIPYNWPGTSAREKLERLERVLPDGTYLCAGSVGSEHWPKERRKEAESWDFAYGRTPLSATGSPSAVTSCSSSAPRTKGRPGRGRSGRCPERPLSAATGLCKTPGSMYH